MILKRDIEEQCREYLPKWVTFIPNLICIIEDRRGQNLSSSSNDRAVSIYITADFIHSVRGRVSVQRTVICGPYFLGGEPEGVGIE